MWERLAIPTAVLYISTPTFVWGDPGGVELTGFSKYIHKLQKASSKDIVWQHGGGLL